MALKSKELIGVIPPSEIISEYFGLRPLNKNEMVSLVNDFLQKAVKGLKKPSSDNSGPLMLRSHLSPPELEPNQLEGKQAIGIDIGGTNLRIGVGNIKKGIIHLNEEIKPKEIPIKYESLDAFYQMLMDNGLENLIKDNPNIPLGCIFSFPGAGIISAEGIDMVLPEKMTKEWEIKGSSGKKLGEELNKFLVKRGYKKKGYLIDNDTVALIKDNQTQAGIVCASGYNWSMVVENSLLGEFSGNTGKTIINTEAGSAITAPIIAVITNRLLRKIAKEENKPVEQIPLRDEYRVSGKYLGKTLGVVVETLKEHVPELFQSVRNTDFAKSFIVSDILDHKWDNVKTHFASENDFTESEKVILTQTAEALRDSSAQIVACHFVALLQAINQFQGEINISSDGPIIQKMPGWKNKFLKTVEELTDKQMKVQIKETAYQGDLRDFRGIFDVMYQAIEFFNRNKQN